MPLVQLTLWRATPVCPRPRRCDHMYPLCFKSCDTLLPGERCSKHLQVESPLVRFLTGVRRRILARFPEAKGNDRPWHIELCRDGTHTVTRARALHGREVNIQARQSYACMGQGHRAFVLQCGEVPGYGPVHVTIAVLPEAPLPQIKDWLWEQARREASSFGDPHVGGPHVGDPHVGDAAPVHNT